VEYQLYYQSQIMKRTSCLAVVPAAGRSRRMGRPKLLLPWGETTVIGATVAALHGGGIAEVVLVAPPGGGGLARWAAAEGWRLAVKPATRFAFVRSDGRIPTSSPQIVVAAA
jgi:CTP:molybdopterin cytidylyltransferase MocA